MTARDTADVAVIGTGVAGLATAHALLSRGLTVTVIGPRPGRVPGQASAAAGAMLSLFSEADAGQPPDRIELEVRHRLKAFARYPAWLDQLSGHSGHPEVPLAPGTWVVATDTERDHLETIAGAARAAAHPAELHDQAAVDGLQPSTRPAAALWLPSEPSVDITRLLSTLAAAVVRHPRARWHVAPATDVDLSAVEVRVHCADHHHVTCAQTVLAAGIGIPGLLGERGRDLDVPPILAGRGVSLLIDTSTPAIQHTVRTPNSAFACGTHLVPRTTTGTVYLGATNRLTLDPVLSGGALLDEIATVIRDAARVLDHRLGAASLARAQVGYRPYTIDHLPLVGPSADPRVLLATATYRCGVLLAPLLADLIADEITEPGTLTTHPYRADRPMPTPRLEDLLAPAAVRGLTEHTGAVNGLAAQQGSSLADALLSAATTDSPLGKAITRLVDRAPVVEILPALLLLADRLKGHPCPSTPPIPAPRSSRPQPSSAPGQAVPPAATSSRNSDSTPSTASR
ncbi:NAD(P)/FAD-dependent oxidoreductase [Amycolatopsis keratiniphila]|uniref:NAD(P)/FAD-dependent oxidoreductase n=1 Tax=Amycolatopsis keratiniphila TaxID=129921 RepID=UPI001E335757|nr:FAD-dependent oxidoreductase [Amycolatopsis keratiniphila]